MSQPARAEELTHCIQPDGALYHATWYIDWEPGEETVCLDGDYTSTDLRAIAEWMDTHQPTGHEQVRTP